MPRAGSTLLSLLLGNHPDIACPPEPWIQLSLMELLPSEYHVGLPIDEDSATVATGEFLRRIAADAHGSLALSVALEELLSKPLDATQVRQFGISVYEEALAMSGRRVFVDKTPRYYHALNFLEDVYPDAKKVVLLRNPLDIAASYKSTWQISVDELVGEPATANTVDFAKGLFDLERYANEERSNTIKVAYEDLVKSPADTLERVCEFLKVPYSAEMLQFHVNSNLLAIHKASHVGDRNALSAGRRIDTSSLGHWGSQLSEEEVARIVSFVGRDVFLRLGYQDVLSAPGVPPHETLEQEANKRRSAVISSLQSIPQAPPFDRWAYLLSSCGVDKGRLAWLLGRLISGIDPTASLGEAVGHTISGLASRYQRSEDDRRERFAVIEELTRAFAAAQQERSKHLLAMEELTAALASASEERAAHLHAISELEGALRICRKDERASAAAPEKIEILEEERSRHLSAIQALNDALAQSESERSKAIESLRLRAHRAALEQEAHLRDLASVKQELQAITAALRKAHDERAVHLSEIGRLTEVSHQCEAAHVANLQTIDELRTALDQAKREYEETVRLKGTLFDILERRPIRFALKLLGIAIPTRKVTRSLEQNKNLKS